MQEATQGSRHSAPRLLGRVLGQGVPLLGVAAIAAFNGSLLSFVTDSVPYSPVFDSIFYYLDSFARGTPFYSPRLYSNLTPPFIALMTLLVAGIPAAVYERLKGLKASTPMSLTIWLVAAGLLSLPTFMGALNGNELDY